MHNRRVHLALSLAIPAVFPPQPAIAQGVSPARTVFSDAMVEVDDAGASATWGDHVSDDEYTAAPTITE